MDKKNHIDLFGASALILFSALLGLNQVLIKVVNAGMEPVFQAGLRSVCAFFPVLLFALLARKKLSVSDGSLLPGVVSGSLFGLEFILLFKALDYTSVARASVFFYTMPFWLTAGAHFLLPGQRLTLVKITGMALAFIGVVVALLDQAAPATPKAFLGDILCLVGAVFWAAIVLLTRATRLRNSQPEMQLLYQLAVSAPILMAVAFYNGELLRQPDTLIWAVFAFQVLVVVAAGFLTWFWLLSIYPAGEVAVYAFLAPVFGVLSGWLILNESISWKLALALLLVASGIVLVNRKPATSRG